MTGAETPDVFCAVFEYPDFMATWTLNYSNSYENGWSIQFQGDKGTMIVDEDGYRVWKEPWKENREPVEKPTPPSRSSPTFRIFWIASSRARDRKLRSKWEPAPSPDRIWLIRVPPAPAGSSGSGRSRFVNLLWPKFGR